MNTIHKLKSYESGDMTIHYWIDDEDIVAMSITPTELNNQIAERRLLINDEASIKPIYEVFGDDFLTCTLENLVQLKVVGDVHPVGFSGGTSMLNSVSTRNMKYVNQSVKIDGDKHTITTELTDKRGLEALHHLSFWENKPFLDVFTEIINKSATALTLEMLSSFSLGGLSPFQSDDGVGKYNIHRFLSNWSAEGRHESRPAELLNLEKSWTGHGARSLRFGQVGSMPVKGYFPFVALEDREYKVLWGAQIAHPGSWQLEVSRQTDMLNISGGLADREFGHWKKTINSGDTFKTPIAIISCCIGDIQDLTTRMVRYQDNSNNIPGSEEDLPIIFNDWCTSWGHPSEVNMLRTANRLQDSNVKYLVMDDGWFNEKPGFQRGLGDWNIAKKIYPHGFKNLCDRLCEKGFIPGVWFELENCTEGSEIFNKTEHLLHRDGYVLQYGNRRFLDFRDPWVHEYLYEKVIKMLIDNNITYIKSDYNDSIGLGCDDDDSLGEGLRAHLEGVQKFYRRMREEIPELVIEICSSGGHRLEPSWMAIGSMGGFSDSHEGVDIPIIGANTQTMIPARKNQIWAVLRKENSLSRLYYSMSATFLGRMCLSGDIHELDDKQMNVINIGMKTYVKLKESIKEGSSRRFGSEMLSYTHPEGYQAVIRTHDNGREAFAVIHSFRNAPDAVSVPLTGFWEISETYKEERLSVSINEKSLNISGIGDFNGMVIALRAMN